MTWRLQPGGEVGRALARLRAAWPVDHGIVGLGAPALAALGRELPGLRTFPVVSGPVIDGRTAAAPSTQQALWVFVRGLERGTIFDPEAFMVRRSMPFATAAGSGLEFIAFVESLDRFERMMMRMVGSDDGIVDGLFAFSRPVTGGYYWCPAVRDGRLDLSPLGL